MAPVRLALLVALSLPLHGDSSRALKYAEVLSTRAVVAEMAAMVDDSVRGPRDAEIAAFLVINTAGYLELKRWDNTAKSRKQSFSGIVPPGTVGIVHTHPSGWDRPSGGDRREARRIGLPIYVLTRRHIWVAEPDGRTIALISNENWRDERRSR